MLRIHRLRVLRALEVEREPLLDARHPRSLREIEEQHQVQHQRRGEDRIAAQKVDLDLHRIPEPAEDVDVVPAFFVVTARRVVVDAHLVKDVPVQLRIHIRLQDILEHPELRFLLRLEALRVVQHLPVAVAENVRRVPAVRLQQRLARLEVLPADRDPALVRQRHQRVRVDREIRRAIGEGYPLHKRRPGVDHRGRDALVVRLHRCFKVLEIAMRLSRLEENFRGRAPDHDQPVAAVPLLELADVLADRLRRLHLRSRLLDICPLQTLHIEVVEHSGHWLDCLEERPDRLDVLVPVENTTVRGRLVGVVWDRVPRPKHKLIQFGKRDKLAHQRRLPF